MAPNPLRIELLGGFRVRVGDDAVPAEAWRRRKVRRLVEFLALAHSHRLHREQLMELLWPDLAPAAAANNFYQALHLARRALDPTGGSGPYYLPLQDEMVHLCPAEPPWIDVEAFEDAARRARHSQDAAAYMAALDLYAGDLLPDERYEEGFDARREALRQDHLALLAELAELYTARAAYTEAIATFRKAIANDAAHEDAHRGLMRVYALDGQRAQALRQYGALQEALEGELGAKPEERSRQLHQQILDGTYPPARSQQSPAPAIAEIALQPPHAPDIPHNLPIPATSFVGRERERAEVSALLATTRLLTLTGPGGCGKTRLALATAMDVRGGYPDGAWLIALAPLADPELVPQAVAATFGVWEAAGRPILETLIGYLKPRRALLALDNCEHLVDACARLCDALLGTCPHIRLLATSREPLHVAGETTWPVPSLPLPDMHKPPSPDTLMNYAAVRLFVDRARAAVPPFALNEGNAATVAEICASLDGLPLAIELAAAQVRVLAPQQIAGRLADRFRLLVGGSRTAQSRQQTLKAALDWSYHLLAERERTIYRRLAVFARGFSLDAAELVGADEPIQTAEILAIVTALVDKSLLLMEDQGGAARYRFLNTIRQYGLERLNESADAAQVRRRHARYFLALAEATEPELHGRHQTFWLAQLEREHDNLRAALAWSLGTADADDGDVALRLAGALAWFWRVRGHLTEGRRWLQAALARAELWPHTPAQAKTLASAGAFAVFQGDYGTASAWLEASAAIARALGDRRSLAYALAWRSLAEAFQGNVAAVRALDGESRAIFRELGDAWGLALALMLAGIPAAESGDDALAQARFAESLALFSELGDAWGIADATINLANMAYRQGDFAAARERLENVLEVERNAPDKWVFVRALSLLGEVARAQGDIRTAATACAGSVAAARELGLTAMIEPWSLRSLGFVACAQGDLPRARAHFAESLKLFRAGDATLGIAACLAGFAAIASAEREPARAARLLGAATARLDAIPAALAPADRADYERTLAAVRAELGAEGFAAAWAEGAALALEQALATAVDPL
jgi:predicted ATPase/DNA-binding SARP family transcriptional activator